MKKLQPLLMSATVALLMFAASAHAQTAIVHVDGDNGLPNPLGQGGGWGQDAYEFLQDGLDRAAELIAPGGGFDDAQVWLAATVPSNPYVPDQCATCTPAGTPGSSGDRAATFNLINNVQLFGGFPPGGGGGTFGARDPDLYVTILSGEVPQPPPPPNPPDACGPGAGPCSVVDGTPGCEDVECCNAVCAIDPFCCDNFWDDTCTEEAADLCTLPVYHVVTADGVDASARLNGLTITGGFADAAFDPGRGGGMFIRAASPVVIRCTFSGNAAPAHGGGAMDIGGDSDPIVVNTSFIGNSGLEAGALHTEAGFAGGTFVNCLFSGNTSLIEGGAINRGGGGTLTLINCTLVNNTVESSVGGGAIFTEDPAGPVILTNCILWKNLAAGMPRQIVDSEVVVSVNYSDIEGGFDCQGVPNCGEGNIDADPVFVDPASDFHLQLGSPCIDKGNPEQGVENCDGPGLIPCDVFDLDGDGVEIEPTPDLDINDRVVDGDDVPGPIVDMGAYEFLPPALLCPWDLNGSGDVGILDLLALLAAWGPNPGHPADFDGNGTVDIFDLLTLIANWGACPTGGVAGDSLEEELNAVALTMADWDAFKECMTTGTKAEQDNCLCWMIHYLEGCPRELCTPPNCPGADPFSNPPVPHVS